LLFVDIIAYSRLQFCGVGLRPPPLLALDVSARRFAPASNIIALRRPAALLAGRRSADWRAIVASGYDIFAVDADPVGNFAPAAELFRPQISWIDDENYSRRPANFDAKIGKNPPSKNHFRRDAAKNKSASAQ